MKMMVVVRLITNENTGEKTFCPVDRASSYALNRISYRWFFPCEWETVKAILACNKHTLTNKWYHIQRRKEPQRGLSHLPEGQSVYRS